LDLPRISITNKSGIATGFRASFVGDRRLKPAMGQVIYLNERRTERSRRTPDLPPAFFFDVSCPLSYLTAERIERTLGEVEWVPVDGAALRGGLESGDGDPMTGDRHAIRVRADAHARSLRLPLVWPDRFPGEARCAQRACAFACEIGAGGAFALAATRLAFCGGFELEDPETLAEAAAAAGVPLEECLAAAGETWRDDELEATADLLRAQGITELPAIYLGQHWITGDDALLAVAALLAEPRAARRRLAPVG
jgi:2-hydroxychromene-2-carboxylate isomerase